MCYGLNVCVSPNILKLKSNSPWDGTRRRGLWKGVRFWRRSPFEWLTALTKEAWEVLFDPSTLWGHSKRGYLWTRKWALTRHQICSHVDLGLPSLQPCEKEIFVHLKAIQSVVFIILQQPQWTKTECVNNCFSIVTNIPH